jgi:Tat protein translocase TatB subunit
MLNIGPQELLLVLVVALLVVGPRRLPELGRSIGRGLREIRKAQSEVRKTIQLELDDEPAPAADSGRPPREPAGEAGSASTPEKDGRAPSAAAAAGSAVGEVSKTLGRSLAELRKARQEIQRSFRVDLDDPRVARPKRATPAASEPAGAEAVEPGAGDAGPSPG